MLLLPFGLGVVHSGNHSLAAGIANKEGWVTTSEVWDLSHLYEHVRYDGERFLRTHDGTVLSRPADEEPGVIFEIGRLMAQHGVGPRAQIIDPTVEPTPTLSGVDGYYKVMIDRRDAGVALTPSGARMALRQAGLQEGSEEWSLAIRGEAPFIRCNLLGQEESILLRWSIRRRVVNDLTTVFGVMPGVAVDDD